MITTDASTPSATFLRYVLLVDAASCAAMGILLLTASELLADLMNLPVELFAQAAWVLLPFSLFVGYLSSQKVPTRVAVWGAIVVNAIWAIDSVFLLFSGWVQPNVLGWLFVAGQAAFVAVMTELEYIGLRKLSAARVTAS